MKQIIMNKDEYDKLILEVEGKNELNERIKTLEKENIELKAMVEAEKPLVGNYLNQITTRTYYVDEANYNNTFKKRLKYNLSEGSYYSRVLKEVEPFIVKCIDKVDMSFAKDCFKEPEEDTSYSYCISGDLLNGTLLESKMREVDELRFQLDDKEKEISARNSCIDTYKKMYDDKNEKIRELHRLLSEYEETKRSVDVIKSQKDSLRAAIKIKEEQIDKLTKENLRYEGMVMVKMEKWLSRIFKRK